jgi:soluble cytochrome b562
MEIDVGRISELQKILGSDTSEIIGRLRLSLEQSIAAIRGALAAGDLQETARAAHHARNDGLMLGLRTLLEVLDRVEQAAREGRMDDARAAGRDLEGAWPATEAALLQAASRT